MFVPKSVVCFKEGYTRETLTRDVIAGVVVGIVAWRFRWHWPLP